MSKNRNLADLLDSTGDVKSDALDNVSGLPDAIDVNASAPADSLNIASNGSVTVKPNIAKATDTATLLAQIGTNDASDPLAIKFTARTGQGSSNYIAMDCAEGTTNRDFVVGYNSTEVMRIKSDGNVGIGTSSPSSKLHVDGGSAETRLTIKTTGTDYYEAGLTLKNSSGSAYNDGIDIAHGAGITAVRNLNDDLIASFDATNLRFGVGVRNPSYTVEVGNVSTKGWSVNLENNVCKMRSRASLNDTQGHWDIMNGNGVVGSVKTVNSSTQFNTSSDYRLKENVVDMTGAIDRLKLLQPRIFNFIADPDVEVDGFIAHEVSDVVPLAVSGEKDATQEEEYEVTPAVLDDDGNVTTEAVMGTRTVPDYQGIDQSKLVPLLTGALQEAIAKIEALETRIEALENV